MSSVLPFHPHAAPTVKTLADKALLVRFKRSMWSPYAYDANATHQVEQNAGATRIGRFNKHLMKDSASLRRVTAAFNQAYVFFTKNTAPWLDDGLRMLRSDNYMEFSQSLRNHIAFAESEADVFTASYLGEVNRDAIRLGPLFNANDYPTHHEIRSLWSIAVRFLPVPSVGDFRVGLDPDDMATLANELDEAERNAARHVIESMLEPMQSAITRLSEYTGEKGQRFHESVITNMVEVAERMEKVNLSDDPDILRAIRSLKQLAQSCALNASVVKESDTVRESVRQQVSALANSFAGLV